MTESNPAQQPPHAMRLNACECPECGAPFVPKKDHAAFCSTPCRMAWNNRRRDRGAMLYDLYMAFRFDRGTARLRNVFAGMNRLASLWRQEDRDERAGRVSWQPPDVVFDRYPAIITRMGRV